MTLGQFATAVGVPPRWVLNALTRLRLPRRYSESLARRLALARMIGETAGSRLPQAWALAGRVLAEADPRGTWRHESPSGGVALVVEMPRFLTAFAARLALARTRYDERRRGPKPRRRGSATARAAEWGIDTSLLAANLTRSPAERAQELDDNLTFGRSVRVGR